MPVSIVATGQSPLSSLSEYVGIVLGPLGIGGIVIVFVVFMLLQREDLRNRLLRLSGRGQLTIATQAFDDATTRISRYLTALAMVNGSYGVTIAVGLWVIGLTVGRHDPSGTAGFPTVILWGLLCAVLRFIPYIGPWIAAAFPVLISLAVYKGFGVFVSVVVLFVLVELVSNNFLEPWLYGASTGMSTVAILVSAVFWTWLWGPIGLVMATPLTVVLVVIGKYVPQLQFLDVMLGDEPAFEPPAHIYQRLLALDAEEALDLVQDFRAEMPLAEVYDSVLLPAMAMAERDRHRGLLDERRQSFIRENMREIIEEMGDQERLRRQQAAAEQEEVDKTEKDGAESSEESTTPEVAGSEVPSGGVSPTVAQEVKVVCLPAHDEADEICNLMLGQLLEFRGYEVEFLSADALAGEVIERIEAIGADVSIISALPPAAVAHARYLCKRIHARLPETVLVVGLWTMAQNVERAAERLTGVHDVQIGTTLRTVGAIVDQLAHKVTAAIKK